MKRISSLFILILITMAGIAQQGLELTSSDARLTESFAWAKKTALSYTRTGDKVGLWYEAALPDRESFCMRDVSHMSIGAYFLGLNDYNKNMLKRFSENISQSKDWCTFWEINKDNQATPVDYTSDKNFWYCLCGNFDIMLSCYQMYTLTGDKTYLTSEPFYSFHTRSVTDYPITWDTNKDGIMDSQPKNGRRGIASYYETAEAYISTGADLMVAQSKGYAIYAEIQKMLNKTVEAKKYNALSEKLKKEFNTNWWNEKENRFQSYRKQDGTFSSESVNGELILSLHFDKVTDQSRVGNMLSLLEKGGGNTEENSYLPLIFFDYNKPEEAYKRMLLMVDPSEGRRTYPEVSYAFIGSVAEGLMGLELNAPENRLQTTPKLPKELGWVELKNIPWKEGSVTVKHNGTQSTTMTSAAKQPFTWRAMIPGNAKVLYVNGKALKTKSMVNFNEEPMMYVDVMVKPENSITVSKLK